MPTVHTTQGIPDEAGTIKGLAQAPLHLQNLVAELIDNALAATDEPETVRIDLSAHPDGADIYILRVWDNGPGISLEKLKNEVFRLGHRPNRDSHLNEHGFGLKNVLAKAEQLSKLPWYFQTRDTEAFNTGQFYKCGRPLSFNMPIHICSSREWAAYGPQTTGTLCEIVLPISYMQSVAFGRRGALPRDVGRIMDYLREHLGVFYRGYLEDGIRASKQIQTSTDLGAADYVDAVKPDFKSKDPYTVDLTLGGQRVKMYGTVGLVDKDSQQTKAKLLYYRHSPESQGIDIRVGKRTVATRLISEVWERDRHPSLNGIAGEFLVPGTKEIAPPTLNNKTSIDFDSQPWNSIVEAIQQALAEDDLPHGGGKSEADLRDELYKQISGLKRPTHTVEKEFDCTHGISVDIIWDQTQGGGPLIIYEVKKGKAAPLDLYQLIMYWDALVSAGKKPTHGHLVSNGRTTGVGTLLEFLRGRKDALGTPYDLTLEDWSNHNINP